MATFEVNLHTWVKYVICDVIIIFIRIAIYLSISIIRPSQGFGETGEKAIYFSITVEQKYKTEGNMGTKAILGNMEHCKSRFWFWGTSENAYLFHWNKGKRYPLWGPLLPIYLSIYLSMRPSQGFWGTGEKTFYFKVTMEQKYKIKGHRGTSAILENR